MRRNQPWILQGPGDSSTPISAKPYSRASRLSFRECVHSLSPYVPFSFDRVLNLTAPFREYWCKTIGNCVHRCVKLSQSDGALGDAFQADPNRLALSKAYERGAGLFSIHFSSSFLSTSASFSLCPFAVLDVMSSTGWPNNLSFVDDFDSRIQNSAGWQVVTGGAEVEGTKHGADKAGMTATFGFTGEYPSKDILAHTNPQPMCY